jgi:uncharacterized phiE125 gp8 family phage protein
MTTRQIAPPAVPAVSLAQAKGQLRLEQSDTDLDEQLLFWLDGITREAEHATGRMFVNRPMRVTLDRFEKAIRLSAPTVSIESVKYVDPDGQPRVLAPADYFLDNEMEPGYLIPQYGRAWPATLPRANAVTVDYTAGYGPDASTTPAAARLYILSRLTELWDPAVKEFKQTVRSAFTARLLDSLKVY